MNNIRLSPIWHHADGIALDYQRDLLRMVKKMNGDIKEVLFPWIDKNYRPIKSDEREDGFTEDLTSIIALLLLMLNPELTSVISRTPEYFALTNKWSNRQYDRVKKSWFGTEKIVTAKTAFGGVNVFVEEPWLKPMSEVWAARNVDLIKSIPAQFHERVKGMVLDASINGTNAKALKDQIREAFKMPKNRAELIAIDQISKLNSDLEVKRMEAIGGRVYQWQDMEDNRVRPIHALRDGRYYDAIKSAGHNAGQEIRCRCYKRWVHADDVKLIPSVRILTSNKDY